MFERDGVSLTVEEENAFICVGLDMPTFAFTCFKSGVSRSKYKLLRRLKPKLYAAKRELVPWMG